VSTGVISPQALIHELLGEAPTLHRTGVVLADLPMPRSSAASSRSLSSTGMPALANTMAMPPPMVPETNHCDSVHRPSAEFVRNVRNLPHLALAKEYMDERLRLIGEKTVGESFCSAWQPASNDKRVAASTASIAASGAFMPRCFL